MIYLFHEPDVLMISTMIFFVQMLIEFCAGGALDDIILGEL